MELIVESDNMDRAWKRVRANRGAPGADGMTIAQFPDFIRESWPTIRQQLLDGTYKPQPVRRKSIPKPDGQGERLLGIPCVLDRVIQQAVLQVLTPIFDPTFSESSFGFRPKRSAHGAVKQVQSYIKQGYRYCVDMDLSKFFDRVQHDVLMSRVSRKVRDKRVLRLIGRYLRAGVMVEGLLVSTEEGTPQGGPLSPLLANIMLDDLDKELEHRGLKFVRYADDFLILVKTYRSARQVFGSVGRFLTRKLKLVVNRQKSSLGKTDGVEFLGFRLVGRKGEIRITAKNLAKFKARVREITSRNRGISMKRMIGELSSYLRGWTGYFALASTKSVFSRFDKWIRRRVRMCYWKQWRYSRTRIRKLMQLGVDRDTAITHGVSRKGYWRLAKTLGGHMGMTKQWLRAQGLVFVRYLWSELAPLRRIA
ncbi:MAG: group II intron reverse transcriptase/maturase [bacterium]|nr:group II intron reverse transcriptase/maturase [bacterium]